MSEFDRRNFLKTLASSAVITSLESCNKIINRNPASVIEENDYQFIVVGSGAGGGPLAARLAEKGFKVLVLEAGGDNYGKLEKVPVSHARASENDLESWKFFVKHYENANLQSKDSKFVPGKGIFYPRGSALGGSTVQNAMITMYPDNEDWSQIEKITNDSTWSPKNMRLYFQMIEKNNYKSQNEIQRGEHGLKGWLSTEQNSVKLLLNDKQFLQIVESAFQEEGYLNEVLDNFEREDFKFRLDPNDMRYVLNKKEGVFNTPRATADGFRNGPRERLLDIKTRYPKNLTIKTNSFVTNLIFDEKDNKKVIGVEVQEGSHLYEADPLSLSQKKVGKKVKYFCKNEVILSGGAFNSPQLLKLSGIGVEAELAKNKIALRHSLPGVGKNLQDRYELSVISEMKQNFTTLEKCTFGGDNDPCLPNYFQNPKEHLYGSNGVVISLIKKSNPYLARPDLYLFGLPGFFKGYQPNYSEQTLKQKNYFSWVILKSQNKNNAGYVKLKDANPFSSPEVNFKYFQEGNQSVLKNDLNAMNVGIDTARRVNENLNKKGLIKNEVLPGKSISNLNQKNDFIVNESWGHHASCTNSIGAPNDVNAVLDSQMRVRGIKGLRVVDASSFPFLPGMFLVLPIYMLSEKAANEIFHEYKYQLS
jgi:choline dehydrogenase